jgi:hypothetical protein
MKPAELRRRAVAMVEVVMRCELVALKPASMDADAEHLAIVLFRRNVAPRYGVFTYDAQDNVLTGGHPTDDKQDAWRIFNGRGWFF